MRKNQSGQVLLITLLVLAVATTIGLGIIGRSSTDVSISNRIEESARAFSAAEAGIEQALVSGEGIGTTVLTPGVNYTVNVTTLGGVGPYQFPNKTQGGNVETLWLAPFDPATGTFDETNAFSGSSINVCWSQESTVPAVLVSIYYKTGGNLQVARGAYDPSSRSNSFASVGAPTNGCSQSGVYVQQISLAALGTPLMMRIAPVYSSAQFFVDPGGVPLPLQGTRVESIGETTTGVTRKIVAFQEYKTPSVIFDSVIYTPGSFAQ